MALSNCYHLKTATEQRACFVCGKLSSSVFDAPDDFFFICLSHTKDQSFCSIVFRINTNDEESEIQSLKLEIDGLKKQLSEKSDIKEENKNDTLINVINEIRNSPKNNQEIVKQYKLHASFIYLREKEALKKEKWNLLKNLK